MKRLVMDSRGGQTLYFGARSSERFGRCYDKGVESNSDEPGRWWRWEVECKQDVARQLAAALVLEPEPAAFVRGVVAGFFAARAGVTIAQLRGSHFHKIASDLPSGAKLLHWLASGVRPTVAKLVRVYGRERVLHALGLSLKSAVQESNTTTAP